MQQIVECVPNFSDGRRPEVYRAIADAIGSVSGAHVLDVSADADHNRTVITFVGSPAAVEEAAFRAIGKAAELINLDEHQGEHPRIGATDVCPFVPVKGVTIEECVDLANRLGQRVGDELGVAVYLYGKAATRPEREKLADIRRGEYERWREEVVTDPARQPDFGPAEPKPWGATVIGVRPFLIAYNIYLNTDDVDVASQIARAVRNSSGGLRHVQAMGFTVEGQAQVSMNLTDYTRTPIFRVQEMVRREAARYGLTITKAELVGLAPQNALLEAAQWYLQIDDLQDEQVLEIRIAQEENRDYTPRALLNAVSAATPTPGGGSVAAAAAALGAALVQMVANLTAGRKKYEDVEQEILGVSGRAAEMQQELSAAIAEDAAAFDDLMAAWRDRTLSEQARADAIELATIHAAEVPLDVARMSLQVAELSQVIAQIGNSNAVTDAAAGGIMARAALQIAAMNVRVNAKSVADQELANLWRRELSELESAMEKSVSGIVATAAKRGGF